MRNFFKVTAISTLLSLTALAQQSNTRAASSSVYLAPSIGLSAFTLKAPGYSVGATGGFAAGANMYVPVLSEDLGFEAGLLYLQTGGAQGDDSLTNELTFGNIAVPLGVRWTFLRPTSEAGTFVYLKGGITPTYLVSAKQKVSNRTSGASLELDIKDDTNSTDIMGYMGAGGSYEMGSNSQLIYELVYSRGTRSVLKSIEAKNEGFLASVMYSIGI